MCSEAEARKILAGDRAEALVRIVDGAWEAHVAENRARSKRTRANVIWDYMINDADLRLAAMEGVHRIERCGSPMYVFEQQMILRFKKHDRELLTRNIATANQSQIFKQEPFEGFANAVHVSCGYLLDRAEAAIERIVIVKRVCGVREWFIDMRELAAGVLEPATPMLGLTSNDATLPNIAIARKEENGRLRDQ